MKSSTIIIPLIISLFLYASCSENKADKETSSENNNSEEINTYKEKCESFAIEVYGDAQGFSILESRIDKSEVVKLALDEKYEGDTKYISSVKIKTDEGNDYCTCYQDDEGNILNKEMYIK